MLGFLGGLAGGLMNFFGQQSTNSANQQMMQEQQQFNAGQSQINRDWQERMSNTAYQRASADMQQAGLNPAMMFGAGSSASTPSGGAASSPQSPPRTSPMSAVVGGMQQAISSAVSMKSMDKMTEEISNLKVDNSLLAEKVKTQEEETRLTHARKQTELEKPHLIEAEAQKTKAQVPIVGSELEKARAIEEVYKNPITRKVMQSGVVGSAAKDAISPVKEVADTLLSSALRKRGLDILRDRVEDQKLRTSRDWY